MGYGNETTNEFVDVLNTIDSTHLTELRQLNENNFARFDAKLEQRMAELRAEFRTAIADLRTEFRTALADLRTHTDRTIADLRAHTDIGFESLRREIAQANSVALRWFVGLTVTTLVTVAGTLIAAALR